MKVHVSNTHGLMKRPDISLLNFEPLRDDRYVYLKSSIAQLIIVYNLN